MVNMEYTPMPDKNAHYVARSYVRKFLSTYATPSALDELLDAMDDSDWRELVASVRAEIMGE